MKMEIERQFAKFRRFRQAIGQFSQPKRVNLGELPPQRRHFAHILQPFATILHGCRFAKLEIYGFLLLKKRQPHPLML